MHVDKKVNKIRVYTIDFITQSREEGGQQQCDQIVAKTPNRDVLEVQMSLIFEKCRLAFFVTFKAKKAFLILADFTPFLLHF